MLNKVQLIGNLGKDPEIKTFDSGNKVCQFSMATSETYKDKSGEKKTDTEWHNIVVWGKLAELCEKYLKKGSRVYLEGKIKTRSWTDKEGIKKYTTEIVCGEVKFLTPATEGSKPQNSAAPIDEENSFTPSNGSQEDDLPF